MYHAICVFTDNKTIKISAESLFDLKDGFWVNKKLEFTKGSDCKFWIPPSRICYIEKDDVEN